ncbi:hypothetical protein EST38_g11154 [Candolleomyces aberdarensis]|uniref:Uncharacterized protein n=1 Tax=Candolleomyces aberdarensis TaxID=2316362 RepID=A0A4Q2D5K7_9AGAR|nr:hypothetical protein EST38_g11154 [Candolleomyces aberdarensis]
MTPKPLFKTRENSGEDRKQRKEIVEFAQKCAKEKEDNRKERQKKAQAKKSHLDQLELILDANAIKDLKGAALRDMFDKFKEANAPDLGKVDKGCYGKVGDIQDAIVKAIDSYHKKKWVPALDSLAEGNEEVILADDEASD